MKPPFVATIRDTNNPQGYGTGFRLFFGAPQISITRLQFGGHGTWLSLSGYATCQTDNLQARTNLNSAEVWQTIGSAMAGIDGTFQFLDTKASKQLAQFYRSVTP